MDLLRWYTEHIRRVRKLSLILGDNKDRSRFLPERQIPFSVKECIMEKVQVKCIKNGPYEIQGTLTIVDANDKTLSQSGNATYYLCRCGGSKTKPMCDGTHERIHFQSE